MLTITKRFDNLPFAHRQPNHAGHCSLIHGHNWSFEFTFTADEVDQNGFIVDFGDLKWLRRWLENNFDHTLVLNDDDPFLQDFEDFCKAEPGDARSNDPGCPQLAKLVTVPNCGAEGLATFVYEQVNKLLMTLYVSRRVKVTKVIVYEDNKNSATYEL